MKNNDDFSDAIRHIADATREPVKLARWPTMQIVQPDGSVRTVPMPATWHSPRRRDNNFFPPKPGVIFRFKRWLSQRGKRP